MEIDPRSYLLVSEKNARLSTISENHKTGLHSQSTTDEYQMTIYNGLQLLYEFIKEP